jgi:aminomethyltransferase
MKQTVLHQKHLQLKAKMTDFQGWQVPLQYTDVQDEHHAVRTAAGLFDVSFLGRIEITGQGSAAFLQKVFTRNTGKMAEGSAHYGFICNESGYILDDSVLFCLSERKEGNHYLLSTNAVNTEKMLLWLKKHASPAVQVTDATQTTAQLALQGPQSPHILEKLVGAHFKKVKARTVRKMNILDTVVTVSRTGYTGEHGYEFTVPADRAEALWDAVMTAGSEPGIMPCGLASRDILRMEMGYLLYGNDIDETRTPLEAGLDAFVDFNKEFIGNDALLKLKTEGIKQKLAGFVLLDKGVPKSGGSIFSENREIGVVTSGCQSPHLRKGIGLGYVISRYAQPGQEIEIEVRDREIVAKIVELPFYKKK